jgi:hypothetical protein
VRRSGVVDWNQFRDFTVDVTGKDGTDHFEIQTTGMSQYTENIDARKPRDVYRAARMLSAGGVQET